MHSQTHLPFHLSAVSLWGNGGAALSSSSEEGSEEGKGKKYGRKQGREEGKKRGKNKGRIRKERKGSNERGGEKRRGRERRRGKVLLAGSSPAAGSLGHVLTSFLGLGFWLSAGPPELVGRLGWGSTLGGCTGQCFL